MELYIAPVNSSSHEKIVYIFRMLGLGVAAAVFTMISHC